MGTSYGNAFLFTQQPDWDGIASLDPRCRFVGYKHTSRRVWVACIFDQKVFRTSRDLHPTLLSPPEYLEVDTANCQPETAGVFKLLDSIGSALESRFLASGISRIHTCLQVANNSRCPTLYVEGNDELIDRACFAKPGALLSFRIRQPTEDLLADIEFQLEKAKVTVMIGGKGEYAEALLKCYRSIKGIHVRKPTIREQEARRIVYASALSIWPRSMRDLVDLFGLKTPTPWEALDEDFVKLPSVRRSKPKPGMRHR